MARRRRTTGAPPAAQPPRTPVRVAAPAPAPRRWLGYVFAFSVGLALASLIGEVVAADIADQKGRAVDACLEATTILNQMKASQSTPTPTVTSTSTPPATVTPTSTATLASTSTPAVTPTSPVLVPPTPTCPEKETGSWLTTLLGLTFYAGVLGVAFTSSQVIARRVAQWTYRRRLRRDGDIRRR